MTLKQKIQALLTAANTKTSAGDTDLTGAVQTLIDGYGGGSVLPGKTVTIVGACEIDVSDVGEYGFAVRIDKTTASKPVVFMAWNPVTSNVRIAFAQYNSTSGTDGNSSWISYDASAQILTVSDSAVYGGSTIGTWQFIPYYLSAGGAV